MALLVADAGLETQGAAFAQLAPALRPLRLVGLRVDVGHPQPQQLVALQAQQPAGSCVGIAKRAVGSDLQQRVVGLFDGMAGQPQLVLRPLPFGHVARRRYQPDHLAVRAEERHQREVHRLRRAAACGHAHVEARGLAAQSACQRLLQPPLRLLAGMPPGGRVEAPAEHLIRRAADGLQRRLVGITQDALGVEQAGEDGRSQPVQHLVQGAFGAWWQGAGCCQRQRGITGQHGRDGGGFDMPTVWRTDCAGGRSS